MEAHGTHRLFSLKPPVDFGSLKLSGEKNAHKAANLQVVYERRAEKRAWMDAHQCNVRVPLRGER
jgi:hypothetical protein